MPLTKELEELLALITDEGDRNSTRGLLEKHEVLRGGYLRQADYDKRMNDVKAEREKEKTEIETARGNIKKWQSWYDENIGRHNTTVAENKRLADEHKKAVQEAETLREQIKKAAAGGGAGGNDVDLATVQATIEERVKALPYASKDDVTRIIAEETGKAVDSARAKATEELVKSTLPAWSSVIMDYQDVMMSHQQEFGEMLDRKKLADFMNEKQIQDVKKGHSEFVAERREKKKEEELRKTIEADLRKTMQPVPGSGAGPTLKELGPIALRVQDDAKKTAEAGGGGRIGDGSAARAAAASLIQAGKY